MKRVGILMAILWILSGCAAKDSELERGMAFRQKLLQGNGCRFTVEIAADYEDHVRQFEAECTGDVQGNLDFSVTAPVTIAGISGTVSNAKGKLTFENLVLQFDTLAEGQISPVASPWIFLKTLRSGCITSAGMDKERLRLSMDDSYEDNALHLDIWFDEADLPIQADILYDGRRVVSLAVKNFVIS